MEELPHNKNQTMYTFYKLIAERIQNENVKPKMKF